MRKLSYLLLCCSASIHAADNGLNSITVEATRLDDVSGEEVKSADLAEALIKKVPNISIVRRSGIANDIILRGQKKDNINVLVDGAKIYGACPNRMDPPTSHILTSNIEGVEVTEGPYDVENFGTLSGAVKVTTQKPSQELKGEVSINAGSWDYRKASATLSGGNDRVRALVSVSKETGGQYEDGNGDDFADQIKRETTSMGFRYKPEFEKMDAFEKATFLGKIYIDLADNQELKLSYTANRSDNIFYPSSKMDAIYDDSNLFDLDYSIRNMGAFSKFLDFQFYTSNVEHPMSNLYRNSSGPQGANEKISTLTTDMRGFKIKNTFDLDTSTEITFGLDFSQRNWAGVYSGKGSNAGVNGKVSIDDVDTENKALFVEMDKRYSGFNIKAGLRYDDTQITNGDAYSQQDNDYSALSGFLFTTYQADESTKIFGGLGKASRVPDARELYFHGAMGMMTPDIGTPDLDQTTNYEIDLGIEKDFEDLTVQAKVFHSWLKDYIHYNDDKQMNRYENVDATIYGFDLSGTYSFSDSTYLEFGLAYQRGEKDEALMGQIDKDLAEIPPIKMNLALNYDYSENSTARIELVAADSWDNFDADNGEQAIDNYAVVNLKLDHGISKNFKLTAGIDNLFDSDYAVSNTYKDLILLDDGANTPVMLINEPGRYFYVNASYSF